MFGSSSESSVDNINSNSNPTQESTAMTLGEASPSLPIPINDSHNNTTTTNTTPTSDQMSLQASQNHGPSIVTSLTSSPHSMPPSPPSAHIPDTGKLSSSPNTAANINPRRSSISKAKDIFASAKQSVQSFSFGRASSSSDPNTSHHLSNMQNLDKNDPALGVLTGSQNNRAGQSNPTPHSTFRIGVTEDKNGKCRRTMEDTHSFLYNFLSTPNLVDSALETTPTPAHEDGDKPKNHKIAETDNAYIGLFDGHAGHLAAEWCGKQLHITLERLIREHPNTPIPELLDQTFTLADQQLEKLAVKNSGTTAVVGVLRWEDRVPNAASATGSAYINQAAATSTTMNTEAELRPTAFRERVLYTANVGDARIVLCRKGRALRLSYDHKATDESERQRITAAGGLILNNRVNGVLAVTRALGDTYLKNLVTGHPYTTETIIQPETDEFIILACDGLWDVCDDQHAVDLIRQVDDAEKASKILVDHALNRFSTDNLSCIVVRFDTKAMKTIKEEASIGVQGDDETNKGTISEADHIVEEATKKNHQEETHVAIAE